MNWEHFENLDEELTEDELDEITDGQSLDMDTFTEDFPELYEAVRNSMRDNPRAVRIITEIVRPNLKQEINFIGSNPSEIDISQMDGDDAFETLIDVLSDYAWVSVAEIFDLHGDIASKQFQALNDMNEERQRKYYEEVFMSEIEEGSEKEEISEEMDFEDFQDLIEVGGGIGTQLFSMLTDGRFEEIPEKGEKRMVEAPPIHLVGEPENAIGVLNLSETDALADAYGVESIYPRSFVLQQAEVVGFEPYENDDLNAMNHPRIQVKLPGSDRKWTIPHNRAHGKFENELAGDELVHKRNDKLFPTGWVPKSDQTWMVRVPTNYKDYEVEESHYYLEDYETYPPEDSEYTESFRATVDVNCDREDEVEDKVFHPYIHVELEEGTQIALPPKAFDTRLD